MARNTDPFVVNGALIYCDCGTCVSVFRCNHPAFLKKKSIGNIRDAVPIKNISLFGNCYSPDPTTPKPCMPATKIWGDGYREDCIIEGKKVISPSAPVLEKTNKAFCMRGGTIEFVTNGQTHIIPPKGFFFEIGLPLIVLEHDLEFEDNLDKLQERWGYLGLTPVGGIVPDLANALLYLYRGQIANALLSAVSAVPEIGDGISAAAKLTEAGTRLSKIGQGVKAVGEFANTPVTKMVEKFSGKEVKKMGDIVDTLKEAREAGASAAELNQIKKNLWASLGKAGEGAATGYGRGQLGNAVTEKQDFSESYTGIEEATNGVVWEDEFKKEDDWEEKFNKYMENVNK